MPATLLPVQQLLQPVLPTIEGNVDYRRLREQLLRIDQLLLQSGLEAQFIADTFKRWEASSKFKNLQIRIRAVGADRGFDSESNQQWLREQKIYNAICPRSPKLLKKRKRSWKFSRLQRRRSQCEGRIGIVKNNFLGRPLRSKGFAHRELALSWAVLTHNLWVIARLPYRKIKRPKLRTGQQVLAA